VVTKPQNRVYSTWLYKSYLRGKVDVLLEEMQLALRNNSIYLDRACSETANKR